jgi:hypothetical protein
MDPAAAVAKLVVFDGENVAVAVDMANHLPRADGDDVPGLDCVARALARVGGIGPNADADAAEVVADEEQGGWRGRTQGR